MEYFSGWNYSRFYYSSRFFLSKFQSIAWENMFHFACIMKNRMKFPFSQNGKYPPKKAEKATSFEMAPLVHLHWVSLKGPHSIDSKRAEKMPVQMTYQNLLMFHKCFMHCDILIYSYSSVSISQCNFGNKLIANFLFVDLWCNLHFSYASSNTICSALGIDTNQYGSFHFSHSHNETR